jgi:hypothetical protein
LLRVPMPRYSRRAMLCAPLRTASERLKSLLRKNRPAQAVPTGIKRYEAVQPLKTNDLQMEALTITEPNNRTGIGFHFSYLTSYVKEPVNSRISRQTVNRN